MHVPNTQTLLNRPVIMEMFQEGDWLRHTLLSRKILGSIRPLDPDA